MKFINHDALSQFFPLFIMNEKKITDLDPLFSGEEMLGKYLDLNTFHSKYINLKGVKKDIPYHAYLSQCDEFEKSIPKETKKTNEYASYLEELKLYLESFIHRARPLYNFLELKINIVSEFGKLWEKGEVPGWESNNNVNIDSELFCVACKFSASYYFFVGIFK